MDSLAGKEIKSELKRELDVKKMQRLLREFGSFPEKHRRLIWRYQLDLPTNSAQFRTLMTQATNINLPPIWTNWIDTNKEINKHLHTSLNRLLKWLLGWSPELSSIAYLPVFVLPFAKMYCYDPVSCFETAVTVISNWGHLWLEMQSLPPFELMKVVEELVQRFAPGALKILKYHSICATTYAWSLLNHGFESVLSFEQWAQLWDHILVNKAAFLIAACVAYICITESTLRSSSNSKQDISKFFNERRSIDMRSFLRKTYEIYDGVTNWPSNLKRPLLSLQNVGMSYPSLKQLKGMLERVPQIVTPAIQPLQTDELPKTDVVKDPFNTIWKSCQLRETLLLEKEEKLKRASWKFWGLKERIVE